VIDLDRPPRYRPSPGGGWRRLATARLLALAVAGSLLAGVVLGGVATYLLWYQPVAASAEQAQSAVSLVLFAESGETTVDNGRRRVRIDAQVRVVNAGPAQINVLAVRVDQPGVTVRSPEKERQVAQGTAIPVDVVVDWSCGADRPTDLAASVSVETSDGQVRKSPVTLDSTPWIESGRAGCAGVG
jgi:hypothetical protein